MAEDTGFISAGLAQANGKLDVIAKNTENIGKAPQKDGLTKSEKDPELTLLDQLFTETKESLGGLSEQFEILNGVFKENTKVGKETAKFAEDTNKAILEELTIGQKAAEIAGVSPSEKNKTKATPTGKPSGVSILKDLSMSDGLGFIALWWKLDEIQGVLEDKDGKKKKSGGIGDIFKGLLEGVSGIALLAVALIAFAGALLIFQFVKWPEAIAGMVAFSIFTIGMIAIAKTFVKDTKTFAEFAAGSVLMSFALAAFGVALWLSSALFAGIDFNYKNIKLPGINIFAAIEALLMFALFEQGMVHLAKSLGNDIPDFSKFALGSILMSAALMTFTIALCVSSQIIMDGKVNLFGKEFSLNVGVALSAIGYFTLFELGMGLVARVASKNSPDMVNFALGSLIMAGALIAFSYSLVIASNIISGKKKFTFFGQEMEGVEAKDALAGISAFLGFELGLALVARIASSNAGNMIKFALASILMCGALIFFTYALSIVGNVLSGEDRQVGPWKIPKVDTIAAIGGLVLFASFIAGMAVLGMAANSVLVPMMQLAGVSAIMSLSLVLFAGAMTAAGIAAFGGEAEVGPLKIKIPKDNWKGALASIALMVGFLAAFAGLGALMPAVGAFILLAAPILAGVAATTILIAKSMAIVGLLATGGKMTWGSESYEFVKFDPKATEAAFEPIKEIVKALSDVAKTMDKEARQSFEAITNAMVPISESLINIGIAIGLFTKLEKGSVDDAINNMDYIMNEAGDSGKGFVGMMNSIAGSLTKMKKGASETAAAMVPVTETLEKLVNMIVKNASLKDVSTDLIDAQVNSLEGLGRFLNKHLIPLTKKLVKNKKYIDDVIPVLGNESSGFLKVVSVLVQINSEVRGINAVSFGEMKTAIGSLADSVKFLGEIRKGDITRMNELSVSIPKFSQALENFDQSKAEGLASSITAIKNAVKGFGDGREDPFLMMSNSIDKAAKSVDSLNNSLTKTVKHLKDIANKASKAFDKMKNIEINEATSYSSSGTSSVTSVSTGDASLTRILNKWDMEGVPVKGFGAETDEKAMPVKVFSI